MLIPLAPTPGGAEQSYNLAPSKIVAIGVNYRAHAAEMGRTPPAEPVIFLKPSSAIVPSGAPIRRPVGFSRVDYEGELALVVGRRLHRATAAEALDSVLGYTCLNDVTVRDLQKSGPWSRAKGYDTFCPVGPRIVGGLRPEELRLITRVNGDVRQDSPVADLIFSVAEVLAFVSRVMTLAEGDLVTTGTPSGVGPVVAGDLVEVEIEPVGVLSNRVEDAEPEPEGAWRASST